MKNGLLLLLMFVVSASAQYAQFDPSGNLKVLSADSSGSPRLSGPASRLVAPGGFVSLSVAATGANLSYRWFFNGALVPSVTSDTFPISNASTLDVGNYFVIVSNNVGSVTSVVARVELDSDRDGLGDGWELTYFGSLTNQNAAADPDSDGTVNRLEFLDGTNPTNQLSSLARLTVRTFGGSVTATPDLEVYQPNTLVNLAAVPDPGLAFIGWSGALTGPTNPANLSLTANKVVEATFGLPLAFALNTTSEVVTGGAGGWYGQSAVNQDGQAAAAVAPPLAGTGDPYLEAVIVMQREGTASFKWRIDGENYSQLNVTVNGSYEFASSRRLTGATGWFDKTIYLPQGTNRVRWTYTRNGGGWTGGSNLIKPRDTAYVDQLVVVEYADPLVDTDGNGLPDLWEYRFFDQLGNDPNADPDGDGVSTGVELVDGTEPNSDISVKPRLSYVIEGQGTATASPAQQVYNMGQYVTNTAVPSSGWKFLAWVGPFANNYFIPRLDTNNPSIDRLNTSKTFRAVFGIPPGEAVNASSLAWTTSLDLPWYGQNLVTHDGVAAAQSAIIVEASAATDSWLETTVSGPGTLSFFQKTSSAAERDYLVLLIDSVEATDHLSGITDWQPMILSLPAGAHQVRWLFKRFYGYDTNALNSAWVDQVLFTPGATAPEFIAVPSSLEGIESQDLTFLVAARGTPSITYQVLRNGTALTQPTASQSITVPAVTPAMAGTWVVRAQNSSGFQDSTPIAVSVLPRPPNDQFSQATAISGATGGVGGYTIGATTENDEPSHAGYSPRASVWYSWTAPANGIIRFTGSVTNPPANLILAAYQGNSLISLTEKAAGDAYAQMTNGVDLARVDIQWATIAGTTYSIAVDAGTEGAWFGLTWAGVPPPGNDAFAARIPLSGSYLRIAGDNTYASAEPNEPPILSFPPFYTLYASNTLWWTWTAPASGTLQIDWLPDDTRPLVSIFTGNSLSSLTRVLDPLSGLTTLNVSQGIPYAISVGTYMDSPGGHFTIALSLNGAVQALRMGMIGPFDPSSGAFELTGPPGSSVILQFSPNLSEWYPWTTNTIPWSGPLTISLQPPANVAPAQKRFFRAYVP